MKQLDKYLAGLGLDHGVVVVFDRRPDAPPPAERTRFEQHATPAGNQATVLLA